MGGGDAMLHFFLPLYPCYMPAHAIADLSPFALEGGLAMVGLSNSSAMSRGWGQGCERGATGVRC